MKFPDCSSYCSIVEVVVLPIAKYPRYWLKYCVLPICQTYPFRSVLDFRSVSAEINKSRGVMSFWNIESWNGLINRVRNRLYSIDAMCLFENLYDDSVRRDHKLRVRTLGSAPSQDLFRQAALRHDMATLLLALLGDAGLDAAEHGPPTSIAALSGGHRTGKAGNEYQRLSEALHVVALPGLVDGPSTAVLPVLVTAGNASGQAECGEGSALSAHQIGVGKWGVRFTDGGPKKDLNPRNRSTQKYPQKSGGLSARYRAR